MSKNRITGDDPDLYVNNPSGTLSIFINVGNCFKMQCEKNYETPTSFSCIVSSPQCSV